MESKIIQISACSSDGTTYLYALCEDGSVWRKASLRGKWKTVSSPYQPTGGSIMPNEAGVS